MDVIWPAAPIAPPAWLNTWLLAKGAAKFVWFRMLKNSARSCSRKPSEMAVMGMFLYAAKSRLNKLGPVAMFLVEFPNRVSGLGKVKQLVLM